MQEDLENRVVQIGNSILNASRNELYLHMRFLDVALSNFSYKVSLDTPYIGTDGFSILYNPDFLIERYKLNRISVNRIYLHIVFHCVFRHLLKTTGKNSDFWDLACDIAVESVIDKLYHRSIRIPPSGFRQGFYAELGKKMKVLTAEGIYKVLREMSLSGQAFAQLVSEYRTDDHLFWPSPEEQNQNKMQNLMQKWQDVSDKTQTSLETFSREAAEAAEAVLEQVRVENRERYNYRRFLEKFAVLREDLQVDMDTFDYVFYTYGLELYGNMPLIEPQEYREVKKIEDFVITIDTSMSCSGELVKKFLEETYSVLRKSESFFKKVNIHIIQCDEEVRSDRVVTCEKELREYMDNFEIIGNGGTDFRPAFAYVNQLIEERAFRRLKGLIYFTDGYGTYPKKCPGYDVAFVFMQGDYTDVDVPPWAMKLILEPEDIAGKDCLEGE